MKWNKNGKRRCISKSDNVNIDKQLKSSLLTPLEYCHSDSFLYHQSNVEDESKQIVNRYSEVDSELVGTVSARIIADMRAEIAYGKKQYINHIYTCQTIFEKEKGELAKVLCTKKLLQSDLTRLKQSKDETFI